MGFLSSSHEGDMESPSLSLNNIEIYMVTLLPFYLLKSRGTHMVWP